jgi:DNA polymerase III alpha subunit
MSLGEFARIVGNLKGVTEYLYLHVLGEPLTHPMLPTFIEYATKNRFKVAITTNGTLLPRLGEALIKCGAFDGFGITRRSLMECFEKIIDSEHDRVRNNIRGQMDLFSMAQDTPSKKVGYEYPLYPEYTMRELLILEKESSGMYFSGHIMDSFKKYLERLSPDSISDILDDTSDDEVRADKKYHDKSCVTVAGIINAKRTKVTKNGEVMAYLTLEDRYAEINVIVFAKSYNKFSSVLDEEIFGRFGNKVNSYNFTSALNGLGVWMNSVIVNGNFQEWHTDLFIKAIPTLDEFLYHVIVDTKTAN